MIKFQFEMEAHMTRDRLKIFKKMIEIIKDLTNTGIVFLCKKTGVEINWFGSIGMASFHLSRNFFKLYRIFKKQEVIILHIHVEEFYKILKNSVKIVNWENIQIELEKPSSDTVLFKLVEAKVIFRMKLMDIEGQSIINGEDPFSEEYFDYRAQLSANYLTTVCDIIKEYDTPVRIIAHRNKMIFESINECNFSNVSMKKKIKNCSDDDFLEYPVTKQNFSCEYLKKFSQMSCLSRDVFICFSSKYDFSTSPILLIYTCPDEKNFSVKFLLGSIFENT